VERGIARAEAKALGYLGSAAQGDWRAADAYLKAIRAERYRNTKQVIEQTMSPEDLVKLTNLISSLVGLFVEAEKQPEAMTWVATELDKIGKE
jgi:hypothetical protein